MDVDINTIKQNYKLKTDEELLDILLTSDLVPEAKNALIQEINSRETNYDIKGYIQHKSEAEESKAHSLNKVVSPIITYALLFTIIFVLAIILENIEHISIFITVAYFIVGFVIVYRVAYNPNLNSRPMWALANTNPLRKIAIFLFLTPLWPIVIYINRAYRDV